MNLLHHERAISCQVVYAGPGLCGKTTSLEYVMRQLPRGRLQGVKTEGERTIFCELLSVGMPPVHGWAVRYQLQTVPGQWEYRQARSMVLKAPDGIVFVADSSPDRQEANLCALHDVVSIFRTNGRDPKDVPVVMQYNKRDVAGAVAWQDMDVVLNPAGAPAFVSVASSGVGVIEALGGMMELVRRRAEARLGVGARSVGVPAGVGK